MALIATAVRPDPKTTRFQSRPLLAVALAVISNPSWPPNHCSALATQKPTFTWWKAASLRFTSPVWRGTRRSLNSRFPATSCLGFLQSHICTARASVETVAHGVPFSAQDRWSPTILERKPDWQTPSSASSSFFADPRSNSVAKIRLAALRPSCSRYRAKRAGRARPGGADPAAPMWSGGRLPGA